MTRKERHMANQGEALRIGTIKHWRGIWPRRRRYMPRGITALLILIGGLLDTGLQLVNAQVVSPSLSGAYATTVAYVEQFYPLWFTYEQSSRAPINRLAGPDRISPLYHEVVAINDDTLYVSSFVDLSSQPVILTIPETTVTYSLLTLDPYGDIFETNIPAATPGTYALIGPGWTGSLPGGVTPITVPLVHSQWIIRSDKYSPTGENQTVEAEQFRSSVKLVTLCYYENEPCPAGGTDYSSGGTAAIVPEVFFSVPYKVIADDLIAKDPITFLKMLQEAVGSSKTPPLSPYEQALSNQFNSLSGNGEFTPRADFIAGAQAAHELIELRYLSHRGPTNWINFTNIGAWGDHVIERSAITEYIQYGNGFSTAAYYQTFRDVLGAPLDGSNSSGYVLTFPAGHIPQANRFWSLTAYTPDSIELVKTSAHKYEVASYTPGLAANPDGSITIYLSPTVPSGVSEANWLPIPTGPFNVMLRVYGPEGSVAAGTYVPPAIRRLN